MLKVKNLNIDVKSKGKMYKVIEDLNLELNKGESLGIVGESGSGKSVTALAIAGLLHKNFSIKTGEINFQGRDLLKLDFKSRRKLLGSEIGIIFQDPMNMLNPLLTIYEQMKEMLVIHNRNISKKDVKSRILEVLREVDISYPETNMHKYPHQFSGGQRQRILIGMAILNKPKLLIADEATTALDMVVQNKILNILNTLRNKYKTSLIVISHDLRLINYMSDRVLVLYTGKVMEEGNINEVFNNPAHPYTKALLASLPENANKGEYIPTIKGRVPSIREEKENCPFYPRCEYRTNECLEIKIPRVRISDDHYSYCLESREEIV